VKSLVAILKKQLAKIWNWLKDELTEGDLNWLKKCRCGTWFNYSNDPIQRAKWETENAKTALEIIHRIQDVLDAKSLKPLSIGYATSQDKLSKIYLVKTAEILGITVPRRTNKVTLLNIILEKIEEEEARKIRENFDD